MFVRISLKLIFFLKISIAFSWNNQNNLEKVPNYFFNKSIINIIYRTKHWESCSSDL